MSHGCRQKHNLEKCPGVGQSLGFSTSEDCLFKVGAIQTSMLGEQDRDQGGYVWWMTEAWRSWFLALNSYLNLNQISSCGL